MDVFGGIVLGLKTAISGANLLYCFIGSLVGTLIGVLPGLGPAATVAMLMPTAFLLPPVSCLIMLAGIYYGAQYGGSTTSILVNLPGEASSIVTALDGYQMAQKGRAGPALTTAALASFFAGTVATIIIAFFAPPLAEFALKFGAPEYFSLMVLGLVASVVLARGSLLKALGMIVVGLIFGMIGTDINSGVRRFTFGINELSDGLSFVTVSMGMFGLGEIIQNLEGENNTKPIIAKIKSLMPTKEDFKRMVAPILRGTFIGSCLGILPGSGALLSSFTAYSLEKKISKHGSEFGTGAIEGVAAPEAANNAGAQTSFIPMLTMGIPTSPVMALMIGAMIIQGLQPGPTMITDQPELFWGVIASMWVGNLMLLVLNLPLVGIWVKLCMVPYHLLYPAILVFCGIGVFSLANTPFDVFMMAIFGIAGYLFRKLDLETAPMLLALILGPMMEEHLRRAMRLSRGNPAIFIQRPISLVILVVAAIALVIAVLPSIRKKRDEAFQED
mgnify:CR=1 FL=1